MSAQFPSRVIVVTDWLLANLPAALSLDASQIVDGPPTEANLKSTCLILGDVDMKQEWAALGARNRDEEATIKCVIYVLGPGQSQTTVNKTAFALLGLLELFLRTSTNITLGGNVWQSAIKPTTIAKQLGDNARAAFLAFDLTFNARI